MDLAKVFIPRKVQKRAVGVRRVARPRPRSGEVQAARWVGVQVPGRPEPGRPVFQTTHFSGLYFTLFRNFESLADAVLLKFWETL